MVAPWREKRLPPMLPAVYQFRARAQWRDVYSSWQSVTQRLSENLTVPTDLTFTPGDNPGISGLLSWSGNASIYRVTITANDDGAVPVLTQVTGDRYQVPVLKVGDYEASVVGLGRVEESGVATLTISIKAPDAPANVVFSALDGDSSSAGVVSWDAVPGSSGYQVRLCDDSHVIVTSKVTDNRWLIAPLTPGNYTVKVASISQREAAISEYSSVTFTLFGLSTPGGLTAEEVLTGSGIQIVSQVILTCDDVPGATRYEFEYQSVGHANWTGIQSGPAHTATVNAIAPGTYNVRVRAVNDIRQSGYATITFTIVGTLRPPSALTNLRLHAQAGTRASLSWDVSNDPDVLTGGSIHVRHTHIVGEGATWDSGTQVTDRLPGNATLSEVPLLSGTYLVKPVNASGFYSKTASAVVSNMAGAIGYNRVETRDEPNDWPGDKNKATVGPGGSLIMKETGNRFIDPDPPYYVLSEPLLLTTYYGPLGDNLGLAVNLPVDGLHVDLVEGKEEITPLLDRLPRYKVLSAGVVNGRNIWRADLTRLTDTLATVRERLEDRLWVSSSCSLLHSPVDLDSESDINHQTRSWLAFAKQKCTEIAVLTRNINGTATAADKAALTDSDLAVASKAASSLIHKPAVQGRVSALTESMTYRATPFKTRKPLQKEKLDLPLYPTTTIGSFPQTADIRRTRRQFKKGEISLQNYETAMEKEIQTVLQHQEALGLDVLVHGEPERNDMVEYFGEQLDGFLFTGFGWVQSYGSRCVKPPIILGDIERPAPMTVKWSQFAQQQTSKPVKGMLTGPVTILRWSFPREDIDQSQSCLQLALALRDEVVDLESAGIDIIQIDEPAIREGLPLRKKDWATYLDWAVKSFRVSAGGVKDSTQIHTHMCYSDFNEIIEYIAAMDADVISIEASRSDMELLNAFEQFHYPNDIGPGVYDIHSPNVPESSSITTLMQKAAEHLPPEQLWVNPDCGLKTRSWPEVDAALKNMVAAAKTLRSGS